MSNILRAGSVIGRDHLLYSRNRQDAFRIGQIETERGFLYAGVLADGCGSTPYAEVGANLTASLLYGELLRGPTVNLRARVSLGLIHLQHFFRRLSSNYPEPERFVYDHLLATTLGFLANDSEALIFSKGDGQIYWGNEQLSIDEGNAPDYLAYRALQENQLSGPNPRLISFSLEEVGRIAIASDGFEPDLIDQFWGKEHPNSVQRTLNRYSQKKHFTDDATLIILEQKGGE